MLFDKTPEITSSDSRGLALRSIQYYRHPDTPHETQALVTHHHYDAPGFLVRDTDPRLDAFQQIDLSVKSNFRYLNSLSGDVLHTQSVDAGTTVVLKDAINRLTFSVVAAGTNKAVTRTCHYEVLALRLLSISERNSEDIDRSTERLVWASGSPAEQALNLAGRCVKHYDPAGLNQINGIALNGTPLSVTRKLLKEVALVDWQGNDEQPWLDQLAPENYITRCITDATATTVSTMDAAGNKQRMDFDITGLLQRSWLTLAGGQEQAILNSVSYSAAGQSVREEHGNGVITTYAYELYKLRLQRIKTERLAEHVLGAKVLQDLRYEYDPVGNVVAITNAVESVRYWRNQKVAPDSRYVYDSLYQLVSATGREIAKAGQQNITLPFATMPMTKDSTAYTYYSRTYAYDTAGNMMRIQHSSPTANNSYTTAITVSNRSNRAVLSTLTADPTQVDKLFHPCGYQLQLQPGQTLTWGTRGELRRVTPVTRIGHKSDAETYLYDADNQRTLKVSTQQNNGLEQTQRVIYLPGLELRDNALNAIPKEQLQVIRIAGTQRTKVHALHWENGKPGAMLSNDQLRWSHGDATGSHGLESNADGEITSLEEYYPFGGTASLTSHADVEADYKTLRYSGKERDATGLYYYGYRYYQPWSGRWLSSDPAGTVDGLNLYRMVRNNPITLYDDDGLMPKTAQDDKPVSLLKKMFPGRALRVAETMLASSSGNLPGPSLATGGAEVVNFFRVDVSPPARILKHGFAGNNTGRIVKLYGDDTIFAAQSFEGIDVFRKEVASPKAHEIFDGEDKYYYEKPSIWSWKPSRVALPLNLYKITLPKDHPHEVLKSFFEATDSAEKSFRASHTKQEIAVMEQQPEDFKTKIDDYAVRLFFSYRHVYTATQEVQIKGPIPPSAIKFISPDEETALRRLPTRIKRAA